VLSHQTCTKSCLPPLRLSALAPGKQRQSDLEVAFPVFSPAPATCRSDDMLPFGRRNCKSSALRVELESPTGVGPMHRRLLRAVSRKEETRPSRSSPSPTARSTGTDGEQGTARSPTESRGLHACRPGRGRAPGRERARERPRAGGSRGGPASRELAWICRLEELCQDPARRSPMLVTAAAHEEGGVVERSAGGGEEEGPHVEEVAPCSVRLRRPPSTTWGRPLALLLPRSAGFGRRRISRRHCAGSPQRTCAGGGAEGGGARAAAPGPKLQGLSAPLRRRRSRGRRSARRPPLSRWGRWGLGRERKKRNEEEYDVRVPHEVVGLECEI
jgi:hypothetical protein